MILRECNSVFDAIVTIQTIKQQLQNAAAEKATQMKVSEYEKELRVRPSAEHAKRFAALIDVFKNDKIEDVNAMLQKVVEKINSALQKENQDRTLANLLNGKDQTQGTE